MKYVQHWRVWSPDNYPETFASQGEAVDMAKARDKEAAEAAKLDKPDPRFGTYIEAITVAEGWRE